MKTIDFVLVTCNIHFNVAEGRVVSSFICHGKWLPVQHFHFLWLKNKRQKPCCETEETVLLSLTSLWAAVRPDTQGAVQENTPVADRA